MFRSCEKLKQIGRLLKSKAKNLMEMMESNILIRSGLKNGILSHLFSCKPFTLDTELVFFDHLISGCV